MAHTSKSLNQLCRREIAFCAAKAGVTAFALLIKAASRPRHKSRSVAIASIQKPVAAFFGNAEGLVVVAVK